MVDNGQAPSRILVTGGAGFIGQHVVARAINAGYEVVVLDSLRTDVHPGQRWTEPNDVDFIVGDVRDADVCERALRGVDTVIHLAAKVGLGVDVQDLPDYASSNDVGTATLLAAMARVGVRTVVMASSMVVYGEGLGLCPEHGPVSPGPRLESDLRERQFEPPCPSCGQALGPMLVTEDAPTDPRNAYASSKFAQELYASNWARATGGSVTALRYHNVYGPGMPRDTPYAGVAAIFTSALLSGRAPLVFEDGQQRRDFVHVHDVAAATVAAAARNAAGLTAYNVGSGVVRTVGDMAAALANALNGEPPRVTGEFRLGDVRHITADSSRIRADLDWRPEVDFEAGIAELAELSRQAQKEFPTS